MPLKPLYLAGFKTKSIGGMEEMTHQLRVWAALAQDLGSIHRTYMAANNCL